MNFDAIKMDVEDEGWVSVPCDGLLEVHGDGDDKIFSRKYTNSPTIFENQFDHKEDVKEIIKLPILIMEPKQNSYEPEPEPESESESDQDQDPIFQVFFKKGNQLVETKMGSPRLSCQEYDFSRTETGSFQYEEKNDDHVIGCSSSPKMIKKEVVDWKENKERFMNVLKWGLDGIGGFCSLGMAAASICVILYVNGRRHKQQKKLKLQIHPDNKRIKQVVQKANEAMSAVRGVPLVNAQITHGGHYESL
ncbi:uncharacterized protein LOC143637278 [Bidens hawaiensis]|uniref:uncharacterized protein LOC143637278 n=1 Tax=Bidens hawaiensis TaxID=980011 RepID=UPI0040491E69